MQRAYLKLCDKASATLDGPFAYDAEALWARLRHHKKARGYTLELVRTIIASQRAEDESRCQHQAKRRFAGNRWQCRNCNTYGFSLRLS